MEVWRLGALVSDVALSCQLVLLCVETVRANVRIIDGSAHRDRLDEVRGLAEHGAQLARLAIVSMLFTSRRRSGVDLVLDHT